MASLRRIGLRMLALADEPADDDGIRLQAASVVLMFRGEAVDAEGPGK
jgi:hypothetical protein